MDAGVVVTGSDGAHRLGNAVMIIKSISIIELFPSAVRLPRACCSRVGYYSLLWRLLRPRLTRWGNWSMGPSLPPRDNQCVMLASKFETCTVCKSAAV